MTPGVCRAGWYFPPGEGIGRTRPGAGSRPRRGRFRPSDHLRRAYCWLQFRAGLLDRSSDFLTPLQLPGSVPQGSLDPPLMGPSTPPLMGPSGGEGAVGAGLGPFALVRTLAGQGHGQKPPVTLPRYATLESVRSIQCPSMGLLRRPTPGEIVEGGRLGRPCGPGAHSRASQKTNLRLRRRHSAFQRDGHAFTYQSESRFPAVRLPAAGVRHGDYLASCQATHDPKLERR